VDQILNRYVQALGGRAAIERLTSMALTGTMEVASAGLSGKAELIAQAPNKYSLTLEIGGIGTFIQAFDGKAGWAQDPINGLRDITGVELAQLKREADFHREAHLKDVYTKLAVKGKEKVGASDAYVIEATPAEGGVEKLYFDTQNGLLVRADAVNRSPQGEIPAEVHIEDYKEIAGVKIPVTLRQVTPVLTSVIKFTDAKPNVEVDQKRFSRPSPQ
jgi:outer membrane lipoprotein-sorting protein